MKHIHAVTYFDGVFLCYVMGETEEEMEKELKKKKLMKAGWRMKKDGIGCKWRVYNNKNQLCFMIF